jgi:Gpi18-like mannosyltransferase
MDIYSEDRKSKPLRLNPLFLINFIRNKLICQGKAPSGTFLTHFCLRQFWVIGRYSVLNQIPGRKEHKAKVKVAFLPNLA